MNVDGIVKSPKSVMPDPGPDPGSGIQNILESVDSRSPIGVGDKLRGNDPETRNPTFYECIKISNSCITMQGKSKCTPC